MSDVITYHPRRIGKTTIARLTEFRLKAAEKRRDEAIQEAHDRYAEEVRALQAMDMRVVLAQRAGETANLYRWPFRRADLRDAASALERPFAVTDDLFRLRAAGHMVDIERDLLIPAGYRRRYTPAKVYGGRQHRRRTDE